MKREPTTAAWVQVILWQIAAILGMLAFAYLWWAKNLTDATFWGVVGLYAKTCALQMEDEWDFSA